MNYKCNKEFSLTLYDEDCNPTEECKMIPIGSTWVRCDAGNLFGGEVHLECINGADGFGWIEITKVDLDSHFEHLN